MPGLVPLSRVNACGNRVVPYQGRPSKKRSGTCRPDRPNHASQSASVTTYCETAHCLRSQSPFGPVSTRQTRDSGRHSRCTRASAHAAKKPTLRREPGPSRGFPRARPCGGARPGRARPAFHRSAAERRLDVQLRRGMGQLRVCELAVHGSETGGAAGPGRPLVRGVHQARAVGDLHAARPPAKCMAS